MDKMGDYDEIIPGRRVEFVTWIRVMDEIISNRFTGEKNKRSFLYNSNIGNSKKEG